MTFGSLFAGGPEGASSPGSGRRVLVRPRLRHPVPAHAAQAGWLTACCVRSVSGGLEGEVVRVTHHVNVSGNDPGWGGAAGAVVSTTRDWSRFYTALISGRLLPAAQMAQMRTTVPVDSRQPDGPGYGLGTQTGATPCGTFWGHDGGVPGYLTTNLTDRTGGRTATVLISTEFWAEFEADPKIAKAAQALQAAVTCTMFGKSVPTAAHAG